MSDSLIDPLDSRAELDFLGLGTPQQLSQKLQRTSSRSSQHRTNHGLSSTNYTIHLGRQQTRKQRSGTTCEYLARLTNGVPWPKSNRRPRFLRRQVPPLPCLRRNWNQARVVDYVDAQMVNRRSRHFTSSRVPDGTCTPRVQGVYSLWEMGSDGSIEICRGSD